MPRRFPLYAKILCWFFLNLALLAGALVILFQAQFHFRMDWLLSDRLAAAGEIIGAEFASEPREDWNSTLQRFASGYHGQVKFLAFTGDGTQLAGEAVPLPDDVRSQLNRHHGPPPEAMADMPGPPRELPPPEQPGPPRRFIHTTDPSEYWAIQRSMVKLPGLGRPAPLILLAVSDSFTGGGLFFEWAPWLMAAAGAIFISMLLWLPLMRDINRAIAQLTTAANKIAQGQFDGRVDERRRDELGSLGHAINQMAGRLHDLVSGQKRFLGDVAHELCSPLAKLRVALGILDQQANDMQRPYVAGAEEEAAQMAGLVNELLSFSRASLTAQKIELTNVPVREAVEKAVRRESTPSATVAVNIEDELEAQAEPELLVRALANLVRNAIRYAGAAGVITVSARRVGDKVRLSVADRGPGVPADDLTRIFDPFYRVDTSRDRATGGAGLGLAIVKTCVEACGGTVSGRNLKPSGLEVTIQLSAI